MYIVCSNSYLTTVFLKERGMVSNPKMEYQVFLCIFQKNSAMATLGLKEMGKFLWEGREKGLSCWLSKFGKTKLRQPTVWYYERLDTMPLFLLDDLLSRLDIILWLLQCLKMKKL